MLLTDSTTQSQDTIDNRPVTLSFWMAKEIALDLEEKSRLQANERITTIQLASFKALVKSLEKNQPKPILANSPFKRPQPPLATTHRLKTSKIQFRQFPLGPEAYSCFSVGYAIGTFYRLPLLY